MQSGSEMKRFLILSGLLWLALFTWSSTASAVEPSGWTGNFNVAGFSSSTPEDACAAASAPYASRITIGDNPGYFGYCYKLLPDGGIYARWNIVGSGTYEELPPVCEAPNYIDVVSGECVAPEEFCYTNLESESDECIFIGDEDGDGLNCVTDSSGLELCLGDDPLCYTANGQTFCPDPDAVCGVKNGTYSCVSPEQEGCGYFNGERVCFTPDGDQVPTDSPDHPDNGGNLDGNENNDPTDPRDPSEGGDESNQPGESPPTTDDGRASEKTARDQLNELRDIDNKLGNLPGQIGDQVTDGLTEENGKGAGEYGSEVGAAGDQAITDSGVNELIDGIESNPMDGSAGKTALEGIGDSVADIIPQGACAPMGMAVGPLAWEITCADASRIRDVLGYILYALTAIFIFNTITNAKGRH